MPRTRQLRPVRRRTGRWRKRRSRSALTKQACLGWLRRRGTFAMSPHEQSSATASISQGASRRSVAFSMPLTRSVAGDFPKKPRLSLKQCVTQTGEWSSGQIGCSIDPMREAIATLMCLMVGLLERRSGAKAGAATYVVPRSHGVKPGARSAGKNIDHQVSPPRAAA